MPGRSFKPASYLASAAAPKSPRQRPAFTRNTSASSVQSTNSEDSMIVTLKGLVLMESSNNKERKGGKEEMEDSFAGAGPPVTQPRAIDDTPGRKRSQPIAIELPSRSVPKVYTPLSARGDLAGGYFPNHESPTTAHRYHPCSSRTTYPESPTMSSSSSLAASPASESTPKMPSHILTPNILGPMSPTIPEPLLKPMGKYHPSNYKSPSTTGVSALTSTPPPSSRPMCSPTNLAIPTTLHKRQKKDRPAQGHERKTSDVKRKLQQYQRDMIAQARMSAANSMAGAAAVDNKEPISPRLLPAGSPGPITPLELEMDAEEGYIDVGGRVRGATLIGSGIVKESSIEGLGR